jgi:outer membrane receptor protein involved in Fe transport
MAGAKNGDMSSMLNQVDKDLGNIKVEVDALQLANVTVVSNKPLLTMSIDRKVFNVERNLTSVGGTGVDVMKNVPGVNVDIDGNVTMRNAAPQIFVDGRPTTMTLDQIPADAIATVELITNPSAKYDASGGGAGILNIVLKKNRKAGYNGNVRASIDSRGRPGFGGDVNIKQQKVNFFAAGMLGVRKSKSDVTTERTDYFSNSVAHALQMNNPVNQGFFSFGRLGMDYFLNNRNTFTIGGNIVRGQFKTKDFLTSTNDTVYTSSAAVHEKTTRTSNSIGNFRNYGSSFSYKHNYAKAGKELTADVNFNYSKNDNESDNDQKQYTPTNALKGLNLFQNTTGGGTTKNITVQSDYSNPITDKMKVEAGVRMSMRDFTTFNTITNVYKDYNGQSFYGSNTVSNYKFTDAVYAAYTTFSQQLKNFTYQLGLRLESSEYNGNLVTKSQKFSNSYPFSLFPSAFFTYKLNDKQDMQLNYSRKVNRPNFFQLIPFVDLTDPLNITKGNPDLVPEFTNLAELSYQNQLSNKHSLLTTLYFRNTNDLITRYQYRDANPNPVISDSATFNTYANANSSFTYGLELTLRDKFISWWDLSTNFNLYKTELKAGNIPGSINQSQVSWFAKINNSFKLPKSYSIQLSGDYQAKTLVPASSSRGGGGGGGMMGGGFGQSQPGAQGYIKPNYGVDFAIKKDFMKNNAASLTLSMNDVFRTKLNATHAESSFLIYDTERRRDPQLMRLAFNWRFGKIDVSLFKRKNMKGEMGNMQDAQQGMGN